MDNNIKTDTLTKSKEKESVKEYNKKYYLKTREKRLAAATVKTRCELCDCTFNILKLERHKKTKKHLLKEYQQNDPTLK